MQSVMCSMRNLLKKSRCQLRKARYHPGFLTRLLYIPHWGIYTVHCLQQSKIYFQLFGWMCGVCAGVWCVAFTVVWNDYLLIFWPNVIFYYTRSWKHNANNQICWITKVSTHSKTLIQFCWKFIYFKDVYWWFLKIWICDKMRALFIFQIIDYA